MALSKKTRLTGQRVKQIMKQGKTIRGGFFFVRRLTNEGVATRLAIIIPKRVSGLATVRNRYRRIVTGYLKELYANCSGFDLLLVASPSILRKSRAEIKSELEKDTKTFFVKS